MPFISPSAEISSLWKAIKEVAPPDDKIIVVYAPIGWFIAYVILLDNDMLKVNGKLFVALGLQNITL